MPFVEVLWKSAHLPESALFGLLDVLPGVVAAAFLHYDESHLVTAEMVDVRVTTVGPYDRINPDLFITVLARTEPDRDVNKLAIVGEISDAVRGMGSPPDTMIELVLTNRVSLYDYRKA